MAKPPWLRWKRNASPKAVGLRHGFRSGLEETNAEHLKAHGVKVIFEQVKIHYMVPSKGHTYTPDFLIPTNGIIVETKGRFMAEDRAKHLYVKLAHPYLDVRFVFSNPNAPLSKGSRTTNAMWCENHGFKWAKKLIPIEWTREPRSERGPTGPCTIEIPPERQDIVTCPPRKPHKAQRGAAGRRTPVAGQTARTA